MKNIRSVFCFLCTITVLSACSGNASEKTGTANTATDTDASGDSSYTGNAKLSYTVEGRKVNIRNLLHTGGKNWIALFMNEVSSKTADHLIKINLTNELTKEVFNFTVNDIGATTFTHYQPTVFNLRGKTATYMGLKYQNYYADEATISITSSDATHVTGTFSGKFKGDLGTVQINDGLFDVPFGKN